MARKIFTFSPNRAAVEMKRRQRQQDLLETGEIQRLLGADAEQRLREHRQEPTVKTPKRGYNHEPTAKELAYAFDNGAYKAVVRRLKILGLNNPDAFISSLIDAKFDLLNIQEFGHFGDETTESLFDPPDIVMNASQVAAGVEAVAVHRPAEIVNASGKANDALRFTAWD